MKSYVISVSLGKGCYRHIRIASSATLYKLHQVILDAFEFEDDHAHAFFMDNHWWGHGNTYFSAKMRGNERLTKDCKLWSLHLKKGDAFKYLFDFGDEWRFQCKVLRELEEKTDIPGVIRRVGESPEQYPEPEWEEDGLEEEEDVWITEEEANELCRELPVEMEVVENLRSYFRAGARLYGIIELRKLWEIYTSQNPPLEEALFLMITMIFSMQQDTFLVLRSEREIGDEEDPWCADIVSEDVVMTETYQEIRRLQTGKDYCILPREEFLRYAQDDYYPATPASGKLRTYLEKRLPADEAEIAWDALQSMIRLNCTLQDALAGLKMNTSISMKRADLAEFAGIYQEVNNTTRMMANRGYTPNEMAERVFGIKRKKDIVPMEGQSSLFPEE